MKTILTALIIFCVSISLTSCGDSDNKTDNKDANNKTAPETKTPQNTNSQGEVQKNQPPQNTGSNNQSSGQNNNGIRVQFPTGATQVTLNGNIKGLGDNITYVFDVRQGQKLTASVKPAKGNGNIRFNQIFDPAGNADGPFSNQMTYNLNQSGDWKLVVGESNMLGEPYVGEYFLTIEIK